MLYVITGSTKKEKMGLQSEKRDRERSSFFSNEDRASKEKTSLQKLNRKKGGEKQNGGAKEIRKSIN